MLYTTLTYLELIILQYSSDERADHQVNTKDCIQEVQIANEKQLYELHK